MWGPFETYTSKFLLPHTLPITPSQWHLQSYTFTVQSMVGELCFHAVFIWLMGRKKNKEAFLKHNVAPWWQVVVVSLQRFFLHQPAALVCAFILLTQRLGFRCQVCCWFREDTAHWSSILRLQKCIWTGRWFTMTVSQISQRVKTFAVCLWFQ